MSFRARFFSVPWLDLALLLATLVTTTWVATRGELDVENGRSGSTRQNGSGTCTTT